MGCKETTVHHSPFPYQCSLIKLIIVIVYCLHYPGYFTLMGSTIFKVFFFFLPFSPTTSTVLQNTAQNLHFMVWTVTDYKHTYSCHLPLCVSELLATVLINGSLKGRGQTILIYIPQSH